MSGLSEYLVQKREAVQRQRERVQSEAAAPRRVQARVQARDRSGARRIQIRDFHLIADSGAETGGFDLGPSPVEILLGAFGGCLAHTLLIQAAASRIPLDAIDIQVSALADPRAGHPSHPDVPVHPRDITFEVNITSSATTETLQQLLAAAERVCPITSLLVNPQTVTGSLAHTPGEAAAPAQNGAVAVGNNKRPARIQSHP